VLVDVFCGVHMVVHEASVPLRGLFASRTSASQITTNTSSRMIHSSKGIFSNVTGADAAVRLEV
jgi:hypothetical protein